MGGHPVGLATFTVFLILTTRQYIYLHKKQAGKNINIKAPITLHIEYPLLEKHEENLSLIEKQKIMVVKINNDVQFIKSKLHQYQLI